MFKTNNGINTVVVVFLLLTFLTFFFFFFIVVNVKVNVTWVIKKQGANTF